VPTSPPTIDNNGPSVTRPLPVCVVDAPVLLIAFRNAFVTHRGEKSHTRASLSSRITPCISESFRSRAQPLPLRLNLRKGSKKNVSDFGGSTRRFVFRLGWGCDLGDEGGVFVSQVRFIFSYDPLRKA